MKKIRLWSWLTLTLLSVGCSFETEGLTSLWAPMLDASVRCEPLWDQPRDIQLETDTAIDDRWTCRVGRLSPRGVSTTECWTATDERTIIEDCSDPAPVRAELADCTLYLACRVGR